MGHRGIRSERKFQFGGRERTRRMQSTKSETAGRWDTVVRESLKSRGEPGEGGRPGRCRRYPVLYFRVQAGEGSQRRQRVSTRHLQHAGSAQVASVRGCVIAYSRSITSWETGRHQAFREADSPGDTNVGGMEGCR